MPIDQAKALKEIDEVFATKPASSGSHAVAEMSMLFEACIERWTPKNSVYRRQLAALGMPSPSDPKFAFSQRGKALYGILQAVRKDIEANRLTHLEELVHASTFGDLIEQGLYLSSEGFNPPAVVLIGGVFEEHIRNLAVKHGIALEEPDKKSGKARKKKASHLAQDLTKANVYTPAEQAMVEAWQKTRNDAAHNTDDAKMIDGAKVEQMAIYVRDFMTRFPA